MRILKIGALLFLLLITYAVHVYHLGVYPWVDTDQMAEHAQITGQWIDKSKFGINQLIVSGSDYNRGYTEGKFTTALLAEQEKELTLRLKRFFPNALLLQTFELAVIRWFYGIDIYLDPKNVNEMAGVARFASHDYDYLADPLSRQVAYHGLHEVGQMMVDQTRNDMGCTVLAYPHGKTLDGKNRWLIGRNFDFEGGRVFDNEKVMKWIFPDEGYALVSVIWAGMVGAVTGVNERGVYISLNAAGSTDFVRYGTPSTLVLLKALQFAKNADEAVEMIRNSQMFITDIFVVSDRTSGKLFRVEKSPKITEVLELSGPSVVTNHLLSPQFANDRINHFREVELTSGARFKRGQALLASAHGKNIDEETLLSFLRDKGNFDGKPLPLGNRTAIDAQIATHSVIYNEEKNELFVSQGPSLAGAFSGFDLTASFQKREPVRTRTLPRDRLVSDAIYKAIQDSREILAQASQQLRHQRCAEARETLEKVSSVLKEDNYGYHSALGDVNRCEGHLANAKSEWAIALSLHPAYLSEVIALQNKLEKATP
jgi:isopenicillin-N N-acyltransferase-like protein